MASSLPPSSSPSIPSSSHPTPKRKRETVSPTTPPPPSPLNMRLNTNIPGAVLVTSDDEIPGSPRTKVAYNFRGLQLEDGGKVSTLDLQRSNAPKHEPREEYLLEESALRKRVRILGGTEGGAREPVMEIPETPISRSFHIVIGPERTVDPMVVEKAGKVVLHNEIDPVIFKGPPESRIRAEDQLGRATPSIDRPSDSKSRAPSNRQGTPPLFGSADASVEMQDGEGEATTIDPDRAALTWHDDEITGHNPDDPDDDGEGINGIGFRPTPAIAHARMEKRRLQMVEYKNREAREARAKRSERRRGSGLSKASREEEETARRVRFLEAEVKSIISTG